MVSKSILLNGYKWQVKLLGENAIVLENNDATHEIIHTTTALIRTEQLEGVIDVVPAYSSIAVVFDLLQNNVNKLVKTLKNIQSTQHSIHSNSILHHIPVDYEKGLDWEEVIQITGLSKSKIIQKHTDVEYQVEMMGFVPGFIYLSGMDERLHCHRKKNPRVRIPTGAVGIGGAQTGIYALESPGGWQIIGHTDMVLFDPKVMPPNQLNVGDKVRFVKK